MTRVKGLRNVWICAGISVCFSSLNAQNLSELRYRSENGVDTNQVMACLDLAWHYVRNQTDSSLYFASEALRKSEHAGYRMGIMRAHGQLGITYAMAGDVESSVRHNILTHQLAVSLKRYDLVPVTLLNIANGYHEMRQFKKALSYYKMAISEAKQRKDHPTEISALNQAGTICFRLKLPEEAEFYNRAAMSLAEKHHDTMRMAHIYFSWAEQQAELKRYVQSNNYLLQSLNMRKPEDGYGKLICYRQLAANAIAQKQFGEAEMHLERAVFWVNTVDNQKEKVNVYKLQSELYAGTGRYKEALETFQLSQTLRDSLSSVANSRYIAAMQSKFDAGRKELQLKQATLQVEKERQYRNLILIAGMVLLGIIGFSLFLLRKRNRLLQRENQIVREKMRLEQQHLRHLEEKSMLEKEKAFHEEQRVALEKERLLQELDRAELERQRLSLELDEKHRSLLTNTMQREQQKEFLTELSSELAQLRYQSDKRQLQKNLEQLYRLVKGKINQEDDWERIKLYFEKVHPQFFEKLQELHPGLSVNELKFCAYTKMKLNSKEISRLLNINPSSVQVSRYRLKRKLGLGEEVNFSDYILSGF